MDKSVVRVYETARDTGERLAEREVPFEPEQEVPQQAVNLYDEIEYQTFLGFGGAFTEAAADTFARLDRDRKDEFLRACFDREAGNGYSFCRTHMNSCDFSLSNYSCDDVPGDGELLHFQIDRDKEKLIPMIREAMRYGDFRLFFSPWSPPGWMKTNGEMDHGGKLLERYRKSWAEFYAKFALAYRAEGVEFFGLTVQNEPAAKQEWDSCLYTAREEAEFVKNYLSPALRRNGLGDLKIMIWDHNRDLLYERARDSFADPEAAELIWGVGVHWYEGDHFEAMEAVHEKWPDKALVSTECCNRGPAFGDWTSGERYGHEILGDLNHSACAWCDWNLLLNGIGGPNHTANYRDAPIVEREGELIYEPSYWYIAHFSRFIRPGSVRICCTRYTEELECTAFRNPDGTAVLVAMNRTDRACGFALRFGGRVAKLESRPHSILTAIITRE